LKTTAPVTINAGSGTNSVSIGLAGSLAGINGAVAVADPAALGVTTLKVLDFNDTTSRNVTLGTGSLTGLSPAAITWGVGIVSLEVRGGNAGNTFTVNNPGSFPTALYCGTGNDTVYVRATTGSVAIEGQGGQDKVRLGSTGEIGEPKGTL